MPSLKEISCLSVENELDTCPACGYKLGFHTSFVSANASRDNPAATSAREVYRVILICPECGARYDVGWRVSFAESGGSRFVKAPVNTATCIPHGSPAACLPPTPHDKHTPE